MKNILQKSLVFGVVALGMLALPASARADGHWHGGWYGPRLGVGIGVYPAPYYYDPYYYPPVVYSRPAYVRRTVYVSDSVEADVQQALAHRRYYGGPIDGAIGPQTRAAIRAYQVDRGLPVTGRIDGNLLRSLHLD